MNDRAEDIFLQAREMPECERPAFAADACGADRELLDAVNTLLADALAAEAYFSHSFGGNSFTKPVTKHRTEKPGDPIGPYTLVRELGDGGFGVVWEARQSQPLARTVALKILKAGMDTDEVLVRFEGERQALARMDHPHIAKVLDAGATPSGRPYFAMEKVDGEPITAFCERHGLGTRERLALFRQICSAIHHAHQKGVIHRDIKPSNVMIARDGEGKPVAKVIDFGVAKAIEGRLTDHTLRTRDEQWLGTPAYMSPEQAGFDGADIDTRSDIYALGVLLYELITGTAPFDPGTLWRCGQEEIRRLIREVDPPRPSTRLAEKPHPDSGKKSATPAPDAGKFRKSIASELDWIVMKAIEKERDRRYDSAAAFAADIDCFLTDQAVAARPPSRSYLLMKFARRHRVGIHIASAFIVLLVGAVLTSALLAIRARDAEVLAEQRLATAIEDRNAKDDALEDAEAVVRLLRDVFRSPQPGVDGQAVTVVNALEAAAEAIETALAAQPERQTLLKIELAETFETLGSFGRALLLRQSVFEFYRDRFGRDSRLSADALQAMITTAAAAGENETALELAQLLLETRKSSHAPSWQVSDAMRDIVTAWLRMGERDRAIQAHRELIDFSIQAFGEDNQRTQDEQLFLRRLDGSERSTPPAGSAAAAQMEAQWENARQAEATYLAAMEQHGPSHPESIMAQLELGNALHRIESFHLARIHLQQFRQRALEHLGAHDDRTLFGHLDLARTLYMAGERLQPARTVEFVVDCLLVRDGPTAPSTHHAEQRLIWYATRTGIRDEKTRILNTIHRRRLEHHGPDHILTARVRFYMSIDLVEAALPVLREHYGATHSAVAEASFKLARHYSKIGRTQESIDLYLAACTNRRDDTWVNFNLAALQLWTGDIDGYRKTRRALLEFWKPRRNIQRTDHYQFERAVWISSMADIEDEELGKEMIANLDHAVWIFQNERQPRESFANQIRAQMLYRLGQFQESLEQSNTTVERIRESIRNRDLEEFSHPTAIIFFYHAMALHRLDRIEEARQTFEEGVAFLPNRTLDPEHPLKGTGHGGEWLLQWILHREARAMIMEPTEE